MVKEDLSKVYKGYDKCKSIIIMDVVNLNLDIEDINFFNDEQDNNNEEIMRVPKRYIRDQENPFEFYNAQEFKKRFRFAKNSVISVIILPLIEEGLAKSNNRGLSISPVLQLLICLRFYATGSFQVSLNIYIFFFQIICVFIR